MRIQNLEKYRVDDLVIDRAAIRLVFLLESPHTDEIVHRHPLAGRSGRSVSRFLVTHCSGFSAWEPGIPAGCQIISHRESRIALINASNYPLDRSAYSLNDYTEYRETIDAWNMIRQNPGAARRKVSGHVAAEEMIVRCLSGRLDKIPDDAVIVPCGNFARTLLQKCVIRHRQVFPAKVPHPARNFWFSPGKFDDVGEFIRMINSRLA